MLLNMWNIYDKLPYPNKISMIRSASSTIACARWIVTSSLNPDAVHVGNAGDYFDSMDNGALIVHRKDMILVQEADPEELFGVVCDIIDEYMDWERQMMGCLDVEDGLQKILDLSESFLNNPAFIYNPTGQMLAYTHKYPEGIHWHWKEILDNHGVTETRMKFMKEKVHLDRIFQDISATTREIDSSSYIHCSLFVNNYIAGHFVLFDFANDISSGTPYLVNTMIGWMNLYINRHFEKFNPLSKLTSAITDYLTKENTDSQILTPLLHSFNWKVHDNYHILIVEEHVEGEPIFITRSYLKIIEQFTNVLSTKIDKHVVIIINLSDKKMTDRVIDYLSNQLHEDYLIGVSNWFQDFRQSKKYYRQALQELARCKADNLPLSYASNNLKNFIRDRFSISDLAETYADRIPYQLKLYDQKNGTPYYETFKAYTHTCFHKTETAAMLNMHRNSLNYRLEKIADIIGEDTLHRLSVINDPGLIENLILSFLLLET